MYNLTIDVDRNPDTKKIAKTKNGLYRFAIVIKDEEGVEAFRVRGFRVSLDGSLSMPASTTSGGFHYKVALMSDKLMDKVAAKVLEVVRAEDEELNIKAVLNATE